MSATELRDIARACRGQAEREGKDAERMGTSSSADIFRQAQQRFIGYAELLEELAGGRD